jgi:O-antigen/teichoic acid export membrane protein
MSISTVKKNVAANFISNGWTALIAVGLTPFYIRFLGIEAWGMIGIFISLQSLCTLLDLGLAVTLNRELARLSLHTDRSHEMRNLVRTMELIYWGVAIVLGVSIFFLAPVIANHWVQSSQLSPAVIQTAIRLMGLTICLQWPFGLYAGGLSGLQRQVLLGGVNILIATLRGLGTILVLWKVSPTLWAFFLCQVGASTLQTCLTGLYLWRSLPSGESRSTFQKTLLRNSWRFAAGMSGITITSVILTQMDKVLLSGILNLEMFGYYVLASTVAIGIYVPVIPIYSALYPRFTQLVSLGDDQGLKELYHHGSQLISVAILPVSIVIALFSREIILLWTGDGTTAENTHAVLSILIAGTALNALMCLPSVLQVAHSWTKLTLSINLTSILVLMPLLVVMAQLYGAVGAASIWLTFNCGLTVATIELMHRRLLKGEQWRWYFEDVGVPLVVSLGAALLCYVIAPRNGPRFQMFITLAGITIFVMSCTFLVTPITRSSLVDYFRSWRARVFDVS